MPEQPPARSVVTAAEVGRCALCGRGVRGFTGEHWPHHNPDGAPCPNSYPPGSAPRDRLEAEHRAPCLVCGRRSILLEPSWDGRGTFSRHGIKARSPRAGGAPLCPGSLQPGPE